MGKLILILIISSSHQDIAWMDSPEKCMIYRDEHCITPALAMMEANPQYSFVMENMLNLMEYVERHPDRKAEILRYTREGRMEWGATFNQPYESLMTGEELIRNVYFGRSWLQENFPGCDARVYFNPDVPGRAMQMQQILAKSGVPYMVISRYHQGLYRWASPDGTSVLTYSPGHYGNSAAMLNAKPDEGVRLIAAYVEKWKPYYAERGIAPGFPILHSEDFSQPKDFGGLIREFGERAIGGEGPAKIRYSSAAGFFKTIDVQGTKFDSVTGERPNLWLYIHGPTHHRAISAHREAGYLLPAAETFNTVAALVEESFEDYPAAEMKEAWKAAIYPDHGWGGKEGQVTDRLFLKMYEKARDMGKGMLDGALNRIAARIKTVPEKGTPVVLYNSLSWAKTGPVTVTVKRGLGTAGAGKGPVFVKDAWENPEPAQSLPLLSDDEPGTARIEFIARNVPAQGYKTYYLAEGGKGEGAEAPDAAESKTSPLPRQIIHENGFYRVTFGPGGLESVYDKDLGCELLDTRKFKGFEVFTMQSVGNGAGEFGRVQQPTMEGFDKLSAHKPVWALERAESGRVRTVYAMKQTLPDCEVRERIVVYESSSGSIARWSSGTGTDLLTGVSDCPACRRARREDRLRSPDGRRGGRGKRSEGTGGPGLRQPQLRRADVRDPAARGPELLERQRGRLWFDDEHERRGERLSRPDRASFGLSPPPGCAVGLAAELSRPGELVFAGRRPRLPVLDHVARAGLAERMEARDRRECSVFH